MSETDPKYQKMKALLDDVHQWPCVYTFKFIVPIAEVAKVGLFVGEDAEVNSKPSKKGNYISLTIKKRCQSSDEVLAIYERVSGTKGIISL